MDEKNIWKSSKGQTTIVNVIMLLITLLLQVEMTGFEMDTIDSAIAGMSGTTNPLAPLLFLLMRLFVPIIYLAILCSIIYVAVPRQQTY
jgi:hypothetical protein